MSLNTTPRTWVAAEVVTVAHMNTEVRDALIGVQAAWTSYTPTYSGISAIGNATVSAKWSRVGKSVSGHVKITMGSTTTFSAATFLIGLPTATHADIAVNHAVGPAFLLDNSVGSATRTAGTAVTVSSTTVMILAANLASNQTVTNLVPWTWATGDILSFGFEYEAA